MNKLSKRAWLTMVLALLLLGGMLMIVVRYFAYGSDWAAYRSVALLASSTHSAGSYTVSDRNGQQLLKEGAGRSYHENPAVRCSTLHLLGDKGGWIDRVILKEYGDELAGYNPLTGVYMGGKEPRSDLRLTVAAEVQAAAYHAMEGCKGVVGVYNYKTGEILCMLSSPNYDPLNVPEIDETAEEYQGVYVNRFINSTYIPGSTFKLVTAAAALEKIDGIQERHFSCEGSVVINGETITCNNVHGDISFEEALCRSCNVAFAQLAAELGAETLADYTHKMGITQSHSFDGYVTRKGSIDLKDAAKQSICWAGIGQYTDLINPCQYMVLMGAIANGGVAAEPYLVESVSCEDKLSYEARADHTKRLLKEETAEQLAEMMHYAVVHNYGEWFFSGFYAGAKSGTAEQGNGRENNALMVGFVQDEEYPLAFVVIVEEGGSGSATCAPIVRQVLDACAAYIEP